MERTVEALEGVAFMGAALGAEGRRERGLGEVLSDRAARR
jgi:hypothetical protein